MDRKFFRALSYISAFTLGLYASSHFKFNTPIEPHRWAITSFIFIMLLFMTKKSKV